MPKSKEKLIIVVNGHPTEVEVNENAPIRTVIPKALEKSGNTGRPPEDWQLTDEDGNPLDLGRKIEDFGFASGVTLVLSLRAGAGG